MASIVSRALGRFANGIEGAGHLRLDRLGGIGGDLGGQRPDLARLTRKHVKLVADEGRLQLQDLGEVEAGIEIALGNIDELAVEGGRALAGGVERALERIDGVFQRILAFFVGLAGLVHSLLGESAYALWHGGIEGQSLELLGTFAEGIARLLGSGLGRISRVHVFTSRLGGHRILFARPVWGKPGPLSYAASQ